MALEFSVFFRAKSVDGRLIDRIKIMKEEKCDCVRLGGTLDAELPNAQPQLPTARCMVGVLHVM